MSFRRLSAFSALSLILLVANGCCLLNGGRMGCGDVMCGDVSCCDTPCGPSGCSMAGQKWTDCACEGPKLCPCTGPCGECASSCGCEPSCGCVDPGCGCEPACGCDVGCAIEPGCGCDVGCGDTCGAGCGCGFLACIKQGVGKLLKPLCACGGCDGELYFSEWHNDPPRCCDPCDKCGNWVGPASGPYRAPYSHAYGCDTCN